MSFTVDLLLLKLFEHICADQCRRAEKTISLFFKTVLNSLFVVIYYSRVAEQEGIMTTEMYKGISDANLHKSAKNCSNNHSHRLKETDSLGMVCLK